MEQEQWGAEEKRQGLEPAMLPLTEPAMPLEEQVPVGEIEKKV